MLVASSARLVSRLALGLGALGLLACAELPDGLLGQGGGDEGGGSPNATATTSTSGSSSSSSGVGGAGGETGQTATFEIAVNASDTTLELRDSTELEITVTPNGYVGTVLVGIAGLPTDVTSTISPTMVELDGSTTATATLSIESASDTVTGDFAFTLNAAAPEGTKSVTANLTVAPVITIYIPADLASYSGSNTAFGPFPTMIKALPGMSASNTISVRFFNQDSVPHEIHASAPDQGFPHGNGDIDPNSFDGQTRNVNAPGTYDFYPHDLANGTTIPSHRHPVSIVIQ
jgi:hypothetical protein